MASIALLPAVLLKGFMGQRVELLLIEIEQTQIQRE